MKRILILLMMAIAHSINAQQAVGIGTSTPNSSSMLDVTSISKGVLIPRMTSAQRIAIVSPAAGLMVYETTTSSLWIYNGASWVQQAAGGASPWTVSASNIYNSNAGNIGIGLNTNINEKLTIKGDVLITLKDATTRSTLSLLGGTGTGGGTVNFLRPDSSVLGSVYTNHLLDRMYLQQGTNSNQLVLHASGNIGINKSLPSKKLDVDGSIRSTDTITAGLDITAGRDITAGDDILATGTVQGGALVSLGPMTIIGTGLINGNLTTNSDIIINNTSATIDLRSSSDSKGFVQLSGDDLRVGTFSTNTTGKFVVRTGGADQLFVANNGNVGIDVSSPLTKLQILNGSDVSISTHGYLMLGSVTGSNLIFDNNEIMARSNGAVGSLVLQNDGGTVRIGSVAVPSGYKFAINGKMICEEVKVKLASSGWPDYVFDEKYKLPTLNEVEKFIQTNKHLPNIPSAKEVEKNGIEIGDMQKRLMEKVEELTLYVIQLQKQVDELKKNPR